MIVALLPKVHTPTQGIYRYEHTKFPGNLAGVTSYVRDDRHRVYEELGAVTSEDKFWGLCPGESYIVAPDTRQTREKDGWISESPIGEMVLRVTRLDDFITIDRTGKVKHNTDIEEIVELVRKSVLFAGWSHNSADTMGATIRQRMWP
jgi:hypothetical protein